MALEFALNTLGDSPPDPATGIIVSDEHKHLELIRQAKAAEAAGFHLFQVGEHHFNYYQISAPVVVLAAVAQHTSRIRLGTGVTLMPTVDPVVVAEDFATLDVMSGGRAEVGAGRGIHEDIFRVTGRNASDATDLMIENVGLLHRLLSEQGVTWSGRFRPPLDNITIRPRPLQRPIPIWNGSTSNLTQAAELGLPCIWGSVLYPYDQLAPFAARYREAWDKAGRAAADVQLGIACHCHVASTTGAARARFAPYYDAYFERSREIQKSNIPRALDQGTRSASPLDSVPLCSGPQEMIDRIGHAQELLGLTRISLLIDMAGVPADVVLEQIAIFGEEIIPAFNG